MFSYDALTAKCRCLAGKLLTAEQYAALSEKNSFADAVAFLKEETSYSARLDQVDPSKVRRARLESLLEGDLIDAYAKLYVFASGADRHFIGDLAKEYEIRYLLDAVRATEYDDSMEFYNIPRFIREHSSVDFARIFRTDSKEEILSALSGTEYAEILKPILETSGAPFALIEAELNRSYYKKLVTKYSAVFEKAQRERIRAAISVKTDLMNISCVIRLRRFAALRAGKERVSLDIASVFPLLMPVSGRMKEPDLASLCRDELNIPETIERFASLYKISPELLYGQNPTGEYGSAMLFATAKKAASRSEPSFDAVFGYLSLKRFEIDNIIYILEALRYGMSAESIRGALLI